MHLTPTDVIQIAKDLKEQGVKTYALQKYRTFPEDINPPSVADIEAFFDTQIIEKIKAYYPKVILR